MAEIRVTELPPLAAPEQADVLHAVDVSADRDSKLTVGGLQAAIGDAFAPAEHQHPTAEITNFNASSRAQTEAALVAGNNITLTPSGIGAARTISIASTAGGGGTVTGVTGTAPIVSSGGTSPAISITAATTSAPGSMSGADKAKLDGIAPGATANLGTVTSVTGGNGLSGSVTASGSLDVMAGVGISVGANDVSINRALVDTWYATAAQGALAATALQPGSVDLGYIAATRTVTNTAGDGFVLPLVTSGAAGLAPQSGGGTTNFLRADGSWAVPPAGGGGATNLDGLSDVTLTSPQNGQVLVFTAGQWVNTAPPTGGGGTVTQVDGGAGLTGSVTTSGALAVGAGTGITVGADSVSINRTTTDAWYATAAQGALAATAIQPGDSISELDNDLGFTANLGTVTSVSGSGGLSGTVTSSGSLAVDRPTVDTWYASAAQGALAASALQPGADISELNNDAGFTANSTDAQLRDRATHTGTQLAATISDFPASSRAQVEAMLVEGANITLTESGSGATRTIVIASTASGGGGGTVTNVTGSAPIQVASNTTTPVVSITAATPAAAGSMSAADKAKLDTLTASANGTVTSVTGGAGLTGNVTTSGALAVGAGTGITVNADDVAVNRTVVDGWYATAAQGALAATALQPGSVDLGFNATTRTITNTGGDSVVLPLVTAGAAGLAPQSGGGTSTFLRADGTWVAPPTGTGTVTSVSGGAGLTGTVTASGSLAVGAGTGITVNTDDVAINRATVDAWYLPMDFSLLAALP